MTTLRPWRRCAHAAALAAALAAARSPAENPRALPCPLSPHRRSVTAQTAWSGRSFHQPTEGLPTRYHIAGARGAGLWLITEHSGACISWGGRTRRGHGKGGLHC